MGCDGDSTDFYFFIFLFWIYCDYASKRSVFGLILKLMQYEQN